MRSGRSQPLAIRRCSFPQSNAPALCLETHFEKLQKAIRGNAPESFLLGGLPRAHTTRGAKHQTDQVYGDTKSVSKLNLKICVCPVRLITSYTDRTHNGVPK